MWCLPRRRKTEKEKNIPLRCSIVKVGQSISRCVATFFRERIDATFATKQSLATGDARVVLMDASVACKLRLISRFSPQLSDLEDAKWANDDLNFLSLARMFLRNWTTSNSRRLNERVASHRRRCRSRRVKEVCPGRPTD